MTDEFILCADSSRAANETLAGTASQQRVWMLLEYRPNWHPKAIGVGNNNINIGLQSYISDALSAAGN